ncbi:MAG: hypothetical protein IK057_00015 [Clostridia bacterium]|nr:hypothetical protein [Clostridia bacterium]
MDKEKFESMLILIVPDIIKLIVENYHIDEITASDMFYSSKTYEILEEEDTKLWHLSPLTIFNIFNEEHTTGNLLYPEEA